MTTGTILAMGGGGFSMEPENPLLDDFLLSLIPHRGTPQVCFLPTASGDSAEYIERFQSAFPRARAHTAVLSLFKREHSDLRSLVLAQDVVYVGGGNTANLLALWRLHGLDDILVEAMAHGVVLAGISAGMNCWFEASITDSFAPDDLQPLTDGLGLLQGSACPHYDGESMRRPTYLEHVRSGDIPAGYAADDGCALLFKDGQLTEAVSSRPGARAFRVRKREGRIAEDPLPIRFLGTSG